MQDSELFHKLTRQWGGRFPREQAPKEVKEAYEEVAERADDLVSAARRILPDLPPIHFDFIFNSNINAIAFKADGQYFIGITTGTVFVLRALIGRMLSDAQLFPGIGSPSNETHQLPPVMNYFPDADDLMRKLALLTPRDAIRRSYAWFLQDQAIMFLVGHELAHVTRGHVDYLANKGQHITAELGLPAKRTEDIILERQCLEFDADRRSILSRIDSIRLTFQKSRQLPWAPVTPGPGQMLEDWAISVQVLFRMFGDERISRSKLTESSYPPLRVRRWSCESLAIAAVSNYWDVEFQQTVIDSLNSAVRLTGISLLIALGPKFLPETLSKPEMSAVRDHAVRLQELWDSQMEKELRDFSYEH